MQSRCAPTEENQTKKKKKKAKKNNTFLILKKGNLIEEISFLINLSFVDDEF